MKNKIVRITIGSAYESSWDANEAFITFVRGSGKRAYLFTTGSGKRSDRVTSIANMLVNKKIKFDGADVFVTLYFN